MTSRHRLPAPEARMVADFLTLSSSNATVVFKGSASLLISRAQQQKREAKDKNEGRDGLALLDLES